MCHNYYPEVMNVVQTRKFKRPKDTAWFNFFGHELGANVSKAWNHVLLGSVEQVTSFVEKSETDLLGVNVPGNRIIRR